MNNDKGDLVDQIERTEKETRKTTIPKKGQKNKFFWTITQRPVHAATQ